MVENRTYPLDGADATAGSLIFSADGTQVAFAAQQVRCGNDWTIGTVDLETAVTSTDKTIYQNDFLIA